jgi:Protein of unknown function (DUF 659)
MFNAIACITTDGWTKIKNDHVVNYMATSSKFFFFLESVYTGQQGHNALWIAADIERVITNYSCTSIDGAVTDNTKANKKAWEILSEKFPTCYISRVLLSWFTLTRKGHFCANHDKTMWRN